MKRKLSFLVVLLVSTISFSQSTIALLSFENSGDTWVPVDFSTPPCNSNNDIWNYVTNLPNINPSNGNQFWGIRDLDGDCGGNDFESLTLANFDISSQNSVTFSFDYNARGFDNGEDLKYELFYDNVSQGETIVVDGISGTNNDDTNGWKTETVLIPSSVVNVSVKLFAKCNSGQEVAGFDNIRLEQASGDSCDSAINLTVYNVGLSSGNELNADTSTTVPSSMSSTPCDNSSFLNYNYDLFYTFTVPVGETSINVLTGGQNGSTVKVAVWDSCNGNNIYCSPELSSLHTITGLTENTTYILQVWHDVNLFYSYAGPFTIALEKVAPPPSNNDCINAVSLTVGNSNTENVITDTNLGANDSRETPIPSCANYQGGDVWYTAEVPASGLITIETQDAGDNIDTGLAIYTGSCGNLTQIACNDDINYPNNLYSQIDLSGYANTTIYIRVWTYGNQTIGNFNIVAYSELCPYTTRWNGNEWNNGIPNSYTSTIINGDYDTASNGSFESCDCTINTNRIVNISANDYISVFNNLTVDGTLEVKNEGSLVMANDDAQIDVTGIVNIHKTTTLLNNFRDFTYWSSPVNNALLATVFTDVDQNRIFEWVKPSTGNYGGWIKATGNMETGKGYIAEAPNTTLPGGNYSVTYSGVPNNGIIPISIGHVGSTESYDGYNLIGNPYPSAVNIKQFIEASVDQAVESNLDVIDGTVWLWTHNTAISNGTAGEFLGNDYATVNLSGGTQAATLGVKPDFNIASGQGFFVKGTKSGTVYFDDSMRIGEEGMNNLFFRENETKTSITNQDNRIWLNVESNEGGAFNQILIGFFDNATDGIDRGYDGERLSSSWINFYSIIGDKKYAIQGLGKFNIDKKINIGFDTYITRPMTYKISISDIEGDDLINSDVFLVDLELGTRHDLKQTDYEFSLEGSINLPDRFTLEFTKTTLDVNEVELSNKFTIINNENSIDIRSDKVINTIKIYDIIGRLLIDKHPNNSTFIIPTTTLKKGAALIINATFDNNTTTTKKIILYK